MTERMVTSETGGRKGSKPAQLGTVDAHALLTLAEVGGKGAEKYAPHNYLKGYDWSLSFNALQRHVLAFWGGEDNDPESGLPHAAHAAWHALALVSFLQRGLGTDDRFKQAEPETDFAAMQVPVPGLNLGAFVEARVHNHDYDPTCPESRVNGVLKGTCITTP